MWSRIGARPRATDLSLPRPSELRFNWVEVRLDAIDHDELREIVVDAWRLVVSKKVSAAHDGRPIG
jgi:hypothetical protein